MMGPYWDYNYNTGIDVWSGLAIFIVIMIMVVGAIMALRYFAREGHFWGSTSKESALEILKKRYVKGEISKKEFEEKKKDIA